MFSQSITNFLLYLFVFGCAAAVSAVSAARQRHKYTKFIFAIAIELPDYKNLIICWHQSEKQNGLWRPFCIKMLKKLASLTVSQIHRSNFIFGIAIDNTEWNNPIDFGANRTFKMAASGHIEKQEACRPDSSTI